MHVYGETGTIVIIVAESYLYFVKLVGILKATFRFIIEIEKIVHGINCNLKSIGLNAIYICELKKSNVEIVLIKC